MSVVPGAAVGVAFGQVDQVTHPLHFGLQVVGAFGLRRSHQRLAGAHRDTQCAQALDLGRIVRQQAHRLNFQVAQHERGKVVGALVGIAAEQKIGVNCVVTLVLEIVGPQLIEQADSAALLSQIDQDTGALLRDPLQRQMELCQAIATQGPEDLACEALGMHSGENVLPLGDVSQHERDVVFV
jgi:hypothetical protein